MAHITIVVSDHVVLVDSKPVWLHHVDWTQECFTGDAGTVLDDVAAVNFDTVTGQGWVEYKTLTTKQTTRPNVRPPDWRISQVEFDALFAWLLPEYEKGLAAQKQEEARQAEMQRLSAELQNVEAAQARTEQRLSIAAEEEIEALKAQNKALAEKFSEIDNALRDFYEAQAKVAKGEE